MGEGWYTTMAKWNGSWARQHTLGSTFKGRVIETRAFWNGAGYVLQVDGLADVVIFGANAEERAKATADLAVNQHYPHRCGTPRCGDWEPYRPGGR
jgi:hypothetical protein